MINLVVSKNFVVVSDLDGTLTNQPSSWQFVLEGLDLWYERGENNLDLFLNKKITYDEFIRLDVELLKGIPVKDYLAIINKITFRKGLNELFEYLQTLQSNNIILSSGLYDVAERLKAQVPIGTIYANEIHRNKQTLTGQYTKNVGWHDKDLLMKKIKLNHSDSYIIAFGDSLADLPLMENSDLSFSCFSNSSELNSKATFTITHLKDAIDDIEKTFCE